MLNDGWLPLVSYIISGAGVTLALTLVSCGIGGTLSIVVALMRGSEAWLVRSVATVYVEFFRSTSMYAQLFWAYFVLPQLGVDLTAFQAGALAISLNTGAYGSEIVRGALNSVANSQKEACTALNLRRFTSLTRVSFPQALIAMLPSVSNLTIDVLKGTSIASLIGISEIMFQADTVRIQTGNTAVSYLSVFVLYFVMTSLVAFLFDRLEQKISAGWQGVSKAG
ncbi:MAG: ectoine/hydroxyectoine ABC transporter permease subunit EhuC [Mesorhizobium sp.]|uniref:ectoine/hydroxyectoine ABC transporter permease subunit EhuC n=1 Tax=Mesorhizobium sp. TaxID=1871066 RepID=UPI000FE678B6|nr:ectoine/hydroxyectoine ABC transporter permease subunit EhuC [Mesorhizobium sp.]RWM47988.1 MAG: ectoine/hydroxyectoine ABC transporter permease subunit EhuC [Mesorhizobium sp.]RWM89360.1 MAG: ectoine/hydroxyectoine ABC transporter permease subunit EhuC [Mesorhizobium sp.]